MPQAIRRIAKIERKFAAALISPQWEPHTPVLRHGIYASKFPAGTTTVWTFVNRNEFDVGGAQIPHCRHQQGMRYFDLWNGVELKPRGPRWQSVVLSFLIEAHGYGAVLACTTSGSAMDNFLSEMKELAKKPLSSYSEERRILSQQLVEIPATATRPNPRHQKAWSSIPAGAFRFKISGIDDRRQKRDRRRRAVSMGELFASPLSRPHDECAGPYYIDHYPVTTNEQFKKFITASEVPSERRS